MGQRICSFPACGKPIHSRGLCNGHRQQLNAGRTLKPLRGAVSAEQRFWRLVDKSGECWLWRGTRSAAGYGYFKRENRQHVYAHRYGYELAHGPIADGMIICHHCDNPPCVRPDHLFTGTHLDNAQDRDNKGRGRYPGAINQPRGERHYAARLTARQVAEIRAAWRARTSARSGLGRRLAAHYGVSHQLISAIVNNQRWAS